MSGLQSKYFLSVDVGTASARAAVFDGEGRKLGHHSSPLQIWKETPDHIEQSSENIWQACCTAATGAIQRAQVPPGSIAGVGFDATCSLVVLDEGFKPVTVSVSGDPARNVVMWMDHRAKAQAERINQTGHEVLDRVGGKVSVEMQTPKLLWLKENMPDTWRAARHFFDLPDYLTWRCTGSVERSACSLACKWTYEAHKMPAESPYGGIEGWNDSFFTAVGLGDLAQEAFARLGCRVVKVGHAIGSGATERGALELGGLRPGTPVGTSTIDAHCGGIGGIGTAGEAGAGPAEVTERLVLVAGTSACHMTVTRGDLFVPGVWGPYADAMVPGLSLLEGGQSATGALLDHVLSSSSHYQDLCGRAHAAGVGVHELVNQMATALGTARCGKAVPGRDELAGALLDVVADVHVLPDFHGNRSPIGDADIRGMVAGLRLSDTLEDLATLYYAALLALCFGTRQILERMAECGHHVNTVVVCGGLAKNSLFVQGIADVCGCDVLLPAEEETVLLGGAMCAAAAAGTFPTLAGAMSAMGRCGTRVAPATAPGVRERVERKNAALRVLYETEARLRAIARGWSDLDFVYSTAGAKRALQKKIAQSKRT